MTVITDVIARAICKSGKFETGEGTCAFICMSQLGTARRNCSYASEVHGKLSALIEKELSKLKEAPDEARPRR